MVTSNSSFSNVAESSSLTTSDRSEAVQLRLTDQTLALAPPMTLPQLIKLNCRQQPHYPAMMIKRDDTWLQWTFGDYYQQMRDAAKSLLSLGLEPHQAVGISGFNSPEWFIAALGTIFAGGVTAGLYPTNGPETNKYVMKDSRTSVLFVEDHEELVKMLPLLKDDEIRDNLRAIVQWSGKVIEEGVLSWSQFMALGKKDELEEKLEQRIENQASNKCAVLIYTSGTTGNPKGAMLSHDSIIFTIASALRTLKFRMCHERMISYLPLSHIAAMTVDLFSPLFSFTTIYFAEKGVLRSGPKLLELLRLVRPTRFFGVPRVYEKLMEGMQEKARTDKPSKLRQKLAKECREAALNHHCGKNPNNLIYRTVGKNVVYKRVKEALGLDACTSGVYCGAAPLRSDVFDFFKSFDILILEGFGLSESCGPATYSVPEKFRAGSAGTVVEGTRMKSNEQGELLIWGRHLMMGYLNCPQKTEETFDDQGWLLTGDQGKVDEQGFVYITGRFKELLITAGGENVAPVPIEDRLKHELSGFVSNVVVVGDRRKFLAALFTLKTVNEQSTELAPGAANALKTITNLDMMSVDDVIKAVDNADLRSHVQKAVDKANSVAVNNASRVQKWRILPTELSIAGGELGPTMKLKRFAFNEKYARIIDEFYD